MVVAGVDDVVGDEFAVEEEPLELAGDVVLSAGFELLPASLDFAPSVLLAAAGLAEE